MKEIYLVSGFGANSKLKEPAFQQAFRSIFSDCYPIFDSGRDRRAFLAQFFRSHLVYLNVHNSTQNMALKIGNGDLVSVSDMATAYAAAHTPRTPALVIVAGCQTVNNPAGNLAAAIGATGHKRAFIGFKTNVFGDATDPYFRLFLAHWMKPRPDHSQRTLVEAREDTALFMAKQLENQKQIASLGGATDDFKVPKTMGVLTGVRSFDADTLQASMLQLGLKLSGAPETPNEAAIGNQLSILGDTSLRASDL